METLVELNVIVLMTAFKTTFMDLTIHSKSLDYGFAFQIPRKYRVPNTIYDKKKEYFYFNKVWVYLKFLCKSFLKSDG